MVASLSTELMLGAIEADLEVCGVVAAEERRLAVESVEDRALVVVVEVVLMVSYSCYSPPGGLMGLSVALL